MRVDWDLAWTALAALQLAGSIAVTVHVLLRRVDDALGTIIYATDPGKADQRLQVFELLVDEWLVELRKVGVTRELLWQEYRSAHSDGYGYSQFCEHLRRHVHQRDLTLALEHNPGEVLMVDFAGKKMEWVDPHSGEIHTCEMLVAVLPFSQYSFCS